MQVKKQFFTMNLDEQNNLQVKRIMKKRRNERYIYDDGAGLIINEGWAVPWSLDC